jgi:hypothetical protein
MPGPLTLLADNGSLAPAATLRLRELAQALAQKIGEPVAPVSLLHSSAVPADQLGGTPAEILEPALARRLEQGQTEFLVLPLFFAPSEALTEYLPSRVAHLRKKHSALRVRLAPALFQTNDDRLARILADHVINRAASDAHRVALVDHGSPARAVTEVRDQLAVQLGAQLGHDFIVAASSMERREGREYDFCEPLLASLLRWPEWSDGDVTVAMQFLLPGRHAGPDGDVAEICREAEQASGGRLRTHQTKLVAEHPLLIDILADRWLIARQGSGGARNL